MEDSVQIKKFEFSDIPQFGDLCDDSEWYSPQVKATTGALLRYKEYRDNCFVAYEGTELVGFIYGGVLCDTLYPQFMFVKEKNRKAGIGKRLMSALEESSHCGVSLIFYHKTLGSNKRAATSAGLVRSAVELFFAFEVDRVNPSRFGVNPLYTK